MTKKEFETIHGAKVSDAYFSMINCVYTYDDTTADKQEFVNVLKSIYNTRDAKKQDFIDGLFGIIWNLDEKNGRMRRQIASNDEVIEIALKKLNEMKGLVDENRAIREENDRAVRAVDAATLENNDLKAQVAALQEENRRLRVKETLRKFQSGEALTEDERELVCEQMAKAI